ncbi:MAG: rhomboid family intramembrane serine protease [Cytophagaceae bacterium]|nr:rhomboid family intramembrane serine protease [Cytophagaceae bacterium]
MNYARPSFGMTPVVKNLIIVNALFYMASIVFKSAMGIQLEHYLGLHLPMATNFHIYQFVTYMFMHAYPNPSHIFFNMFALFMFGQMLENAMGAKRFLVYYFVTGIGAGFIQELAWVYDLRDVIFSDYESVNIGGQILSTAEYYNLYITVGASGAVFGILLAYGMLFPNNVIVLMFPPIPLRAKYFVLIYGAIELFAGVRGGGDGVAHFAHLGGMLFGFLLLMYWRRSFNGQ